MRYFNDNRQFKIETDEMNENGLSIYGSWELLDADSNPTLRLCRQQKCWVTILALVHFDQELIKGAKIPFFLLGESADSNLFSGQIGATKKIGLQPSTSTSQPILEYQYEVAIEIPPHTLDPGTYNVQLIATLEKNGDLVDVLSESESVQIEVVQESL